MKSTGHGLSAQPWLPLGIGIHTGVAYVGTVGSQEDEVVDITALGDSVNTAARLVAQAKQGEIVMSEDTYRKAGLDWSNLETSELTLKGEEMNVPVRILRIERLLT